MKLRPKKIGIMGKRVEIIDTLPLTKLKSRKGKVIAQKDEIICILLDMDAEIFWEDEGAWCTQSTVFTTEDKVVVIPY